MSANATIVVPAYAAPNRRHYAVLALLFMAFVVYGSLVPLRFRYLPFAEAVEQFHLVLAHPIVVQSRSDWLANALLQLPFGFCLMAAICCDRPFYTAPALPVAVLASFALAGFVEFAQLYFPPRVSSINDIIAQGLGGTTGAVLWLLRGQRITANARRLWSDFGSHATVPLLLGLYLFFLLIIQTLPFDFTLSPVEVYHKYKMGRVHLLPFAASGIGNYELANKLFWNVALFAPVGLLLAQIPSRIGRDAVIVFSVAFAIVAAIEMAQLLAVSRYFDTEDILTGCLSVLVSWFASRRWAGSVNNALSRALLLSVCLVVLIFMEWQPFNFVPSWSKATHALRSISLVPFVEYLQAPNYLGALDDCIHKVLLFGTLGAALAPSDSASRAILFFRWSLAVAVSAVLEAGQLFSPSRYASMTDVIIAAVSSGLGLFVTCHLANPSRPSGKQL